MYTVTFYSFKGGVGRSMALVNVAAELVLSGSRVLVVDFDLEAPGLNTFRLGGPGPDASGVVDFVDKFRKTGIAPDVKDYVHSATIDGQHGDRLWVMPAGNQDSAYGARLAGIDWQELYAEFDGYLLFEDLKAQWQKTINPDYVLVDSRTGHTDVGGICTRQLPDAVVVLFFPNEQNRIGLEKVVRQIREEAKPPRNKEIVLHFVMSNVPDLDDEEEILSSSVKRLKESLEYEELAAVIHHYPSLSLLNQAVFTLARPKSRLAQEYRQLVSAIRRNNLDDREGSLEFLKQVQRMPTGKTPGVSASSIGSQLSEIRAKYPSDPEVLEQIARILKRQRRLDEAISLLGDSSGGGLLDADLLLSRAERNASLGIQNAAILDLKRILSMEALPIWELIGAINLLANLEPNEVESVTESPAVQRMSAQETVEVANGLFSSRKTLRMAELLGRLAYRKNPRTARNVVALSLIAQRRFSEAKQVIDPSTLQGEPGIEEIFNYAMADWGERGTPSHGLFERVLGAIGQRSYLVANFRQCLSLTYWVVGDRQKALEQLGEARQLLTEQSGENFSAWRYLAVPPPQFNEDLDAMERMINGEKERPLVLQDVSTQ